MTNISLNTEIDKVDCLYLIRKKKFEELLTKLRKSILFSMDENRFSEITLPQSFSKETLDKDIISWRLVVKKDYFLGIYTSLRTWCKWQTEVSGVRTSNVSGVIYIDVKFPHQDFTKVEKVEVNNQNNPVILPVEPTPKKRWKELVNMVRTKFDLKVKDADIFSYFSLKIPYAYIFLKSNKLAKSIESFLYGHLYNKEEAFVSKHGKGTSIRYFPFGKKKKFLSKKRGGPKT